MGNRNSTKKAKNNIDHTNIADNNNDGIVTREEFDNWVSHFDSNYKDAVEKKEREIIEANLKITDLEKQIESLTELLNKKNASRSNNSIIYAKRENPNLNEDELSQIRIDEMVDDLLKDENINIKYFPDWVEKQLYRNVLSLCINLMDSVLDTTNINFMGHQVTFDLHPISTPQVGVPISTPQVGVPIAVTEVAEEKKKAKQ